jgi:hypothetical protein
MILHHFKNDMKNAVLKEDTNALLALIGPVANAVPISISDTAFATLEVATLSVEKINEAVDLEALKSLAPTAVTCSHENFARKKCIAIPPLLTKVLMDADSEDPYVLLKTYCKASWTLAFMMQPWSMLMEWRKRTPLYPFSVLSSFYFTSPRNQLPVHA